MLTKQLDKLELWIFLFTTGTAKEVHGKRMGCYKYYIYRMLVKQMKYSLNCNLNLRSIVKKLMIKSFSFETKIYFLAFGNFSNVLINKFYQIFWGTFWQVRKWIISSVNNCLRFFNFINLKIDYTFFIYKLVVLITIFSRKMWIANSFGQIFLLYLQRCTMKVFSHSIFYCVTYLFTCNIDVY